MYVCMYVCMHASESPCLDCEDARRTRSVRDSDVDRPWQDCGLESFEMRKIWTLTRSIALWEPSSLHNLQQQIRRCGRISQRDKVNIRTLDGDGECKIVPLHDRCLYMCSLVSYPDASNDRYPYSLVSYPAMQQQIIHPLTHSLTAPFTRLPLQDEPHNTQTRSQSRSS